MYRGTGKRSLSSVHVVQYLIRYNPIGSSHLIHIYHSSYAQQSTVKSASRA